MNQKKRKKQKLTEAEIFLTMPQSLKDRLTGEAERMQISLNALIRQTLVAWLEKNTSPPIIDDSDYSESTKDQG